MLGRFKNTGLFWLWISVAVVALDQWTKQAVVQSFRLYESISVLPFFNLTFVINKGSAWSFLADQGGWQLWFFSGIAFFVTGLLCFWLSRQKRSDLRLNLSYCLIIGGAIGNVIDRFMYGYVVDFLDFYWSTYHYPTFNVADIVITVGAGLMIIDALMQSKSELSVNNKSKDNKV